MVHAVFGLPGSGKTTYLCKIASKAMRQKKDVYTNFPCHGAYKLRFDTLGKLQYENCVMLIDEISLLCDSRNWKDFSSDLTYFFTHHRHYNVEIYYASQWFTDCDVKIRRITDDMIYVENFFFGISKKYTVERTVETTENGDVVDRYRFRHGMPWIRRPYYRMFDSFSRKALPPVPKELWGKV